MRRSEHQYNYSHMHSRTGLCQLESLLPRQIDVDILLSVTPTFIDLNLDLLSEDNIKISLCKPDANVLQETNPHCPKPLLELLLPERMYTYDCRLGPLDSGKAYIVCVSVNETHNVTISRPTKEPVCQRVSLPGIHLVCNLLFR